MNKTAINNHSGLYFVLPLLAALIFVFNISGAHAETRLGQEIPGDAVVVKLASVLENPADYDGKTIVLKGTVVSQCSTLCHFVFQDGVSSVTIYPRGFKFPKLKRGNPVTVYTEVIAGEGQTVFSALGLEM